MKALLAITAALLAFAGSTAAAQDHASSLIPQSSIALGQRIGAPTTPGIDLVTTLTPWTSGPVACSAATTLSINPGDSFGVCYTVTNHSGHELDWHYLDAHYLQALGDVTANAFLNDGLLNQPLADGASLQYTYSVAYLWQSTDIASAWMSQDAPPPAYTFDDTVPFAFVDLTQSPTAMVLMSLGNGAPTGGVSADVAMPFSFRFYEIAAANQLCVGFRGVMFVDQPGCNAFPTDQNFEQMPVFGSHDLISPAWSNWAPGLDGGTVYADTQGTAPNRRMIVEWYGMTRNQPPGPGITFEAVIDEATSQITFQYQSMAFNDGGDSQGDYGGYSTAGIQRDAGEDGATPNYTQYSFWQQVLTNGKAIRWTPAAMPYATTATSTAHVEVLAAAIAAGPSYIQASAAVGASTTSQLTIGNSGNTDLNWTLGTTPAAPGFHFAAPYAVPQSTPLHTTRFSTANPDPRSSVRTRGGAANTPQTSSPTPLGVTASVPAYAIGYGANVNSRYLSLNALAPQTVTQVNNNVNLDPVQVGGFLDNDLTKTYLFSNGYCDDNGCGGFLLQWVELLSGAINTINTTSAGPTIAGELWHGMKWDATTHTAYAVASTDVAPFRTDLYSIDPHVGTSTWIATLDRVSLNGTRMLDIAIAPNGAMYGIDEATDSLYAIDKSSGHLRLVGATGLDAGLYDVQSMDFDQSSGILYYAGFPVTPTVSGIYTMNLGTGHATLVGPIGDGSIALRAFAIAIPGGPCANPQNVPWLSFDRSAGTTPAGQSDPVMATLNASGLTDGVYRAKICISSNTPFDSTVALPVTFTVGSVDQIFGDGFDSPQR